MSKDYSAESGICGWVFAVATIFVLLIISWINPDNTPSCLDEFRRRTS